LYKGGLCAAQHSGVLTEFVLLWSRGIAAQMDLTREQTAFWIDLQNGTCRATAAQDASVIGPLIRANLVRWDVDRSEAASRRNPQGSTFSLTPLGEVCLAEHEAQ
jgi:hypothetical protein